MKCFLKQHNCIFKNIWELQRNLPVSILTQFSLAFRTANAYQKQVLWNRKVDGAVSSPGPNSQLLTGMCCLPELGRVLVPKPQTSSGVLGKDELLGSLFHHTPFHNPVRFLGTLAKAEHWHSTNRAKGCSPVTVKSGGRGVGCWSKPLSFITVAVEKEQRTVAYK